MTQLHSAPARVRRIHLFVGMFLLAGLLIQCHRAWVSRDEASPVSIQGPGRSAGRVAFAAPVTAAKSVVEPLEVRAARDPIGFFEEAIRRYDRTVRDYTCTFTKQERISDKLSEEQVIRAMFREKPFSVRFEWVKNASKCNRVLYVADRWVENGQQMAVIEPGAIARLFVSHVMRPIHGEDAQKSSRRTIDQFGFRNALSLTLKYCRMADERGCLDFSYQGNGQVDKRETLVFERHLPYVDGKGIWPDRVLVVHIDKELLVPVLCLCYADDEKKVLLGKYMNTDIRLNANLDQSVFTKQGMGL